MNPLVSIIIPIYNSDLYLKETIESAIDQTWPYKEIILIDDGSTDKSLAIAKRYECDWIKVYSQSNQGASVARNYGLSQAKGDYIQFLDADDLLSKNKIERQIRLLEDNKNFVSICPTVHFNDGEYPYSAKPDEYNRSFLFSTTDTHNFLINLYGKNGKSGMIAIHSWLTPKTVIDKTGLWNEILTTDDDGEYFCRVALNADGIILSDDVLNYYRKYKERKSLSMQDSRQALKSSLDSALIKKKLLLDKNSSNETLVAVYHLLINIAIRSFPRYFSIYKLAIQELPKIKYSYKLEVGGRKITNSIANKIGWQPIRLVQCFWNVIRIKQR
ncbi:glycosyltransferase family 2 protein [Pedobacter sp. MR22-3]|uniref:glycosyltransferase family 2 protein n=1 Tax=Pedobacter sp. MR22-3 TaxID=2994552 RepID=UPI002248640E|nr:glycosyltransferase family 2 protein [Pedobacter sp. MR22-3]MCX2585035.1 glycosyltransferase family 2 protein [Pedobacter sp. MR22-3]